MKRVESVDCRSLWESWEEDWWTSDFAEEPTMPVEKVSPISAEKEWTGRYIWSNLRKIGKAKRVWRYNMDKGQAAFSTDDQRNVHPGFSPNMGEAQLTFDPALVKKNKQLYLRYSMMMYFNCMWMECNWSKGYEWKKWSQSKYPGFYCRNYERWESHWLPSLWESLWEVHWLTSDYMQNWGKLNKRLSMCPNNPNTLYLQMWRCRTETYSTAPYLLDVWRHLPVRSIISLIRLKHWMAKEHDVAVYFEIDPHKAFHCPDNLHKYMKRMDWLWWRPDRKIRNYGWIKRKMDGHGIFLSRNKGWRDLYTGMQPKWGHTYERGRSETNEKVCRNAILHLHRSWI